MWKWLKNAFFITLVLILAGCNDKADDPYFARPEWLASPIYQKLQEEGNFTLFLKCIDKTDYADVLKRAGYFTIFAPNDSAFNVYLKEHNLASIDDIDVETAIDLVSYSLVFTAYTYDAIDDAHTSGGEPLIDVAYRRKTNNYKGVYKEVTSGLGEVNVVDINLVLDQDVQRGTVPLLYTDDNNYKKLTILTSDFFNRRGLTAYDYNYFFPSIEFKGFNVIDANVTRKDIIAENGYIHEVDKVLEPLVNLEEQLVGKDEFSMFKEILDKYMLNYNLAPDDFLDKYSKATGDLEPVYVKSYPWLKFALNTETIDPGSTVSEDQANSFTMFAPDNAAVQRFMDEKFLIYYESLDDMSQELISDFVNSHLYLSTVWPSRFEIAETKFTDEDIIAKDMVSNGLFYGTKRVQESDDFFTVYGEINLNPKYSLMKRGLIDLDLQYIIKNSNLPYTVFMVDDSVMTNFGFSYDSARELWRYEPDPAQTMAVLNRFLRMHIVRRNISDFSEENMIKTYADEYIKHVDGSIVAAGNVDLGESPIPDQKDVTPNNGTTYKFLETPIRFSQLQPIEHLEMIPDFALFTNYLKNPALGMYDEETKKLKDLNGGIPNTIFALSNKTMQAAIVSGDLPRPSADPAALLAIKAFLRYHFVVGTSLAQGNITESKEYLTAYKDADGNKTYMYVSSDPDKNLVIEDGSGQTVNVHPVNNNILSNRVVIHELDTYLKFE